MNSIKRGIYFLLGTLLSMAITAMASYPGPGTGTGLPVYQTSPTIATPTFSGTAIGNISGNAATVTTNANLSGVITSSGNVTSITSQTGTGSKFVVDTSPTLVTPTFSGTAVGNINGNAATVTTNANLTGVITSVGNATSIASQTGTGNKFVVDTSPTLVTPNIGAATATSVNFGQTSLATYQEGTWTPAVQFGGAAVGITYSIQGGFYTVIGNRVNVNMRVVMTAKGSSTGSATIAGLPFAALNTTGNDSACAITPTMNTSVTNPRATISANSSSITLFNFSAGALTNLADTDFTASSTIRLSCQYQK